MLLTYKHIFIYFFAGVHARCRPLTFVHEKWD